MKPNILYLWLCVAIFSSYINASKDADPQPKEEINANSFSAILLLNRMNEALVKTSVLNEQILDKQKSMETQISKLEEQNQERNEEFRLKMSETVVKIEYMEKSLDAIKQAFDFIKYSQVQDRTPIIIKEQSTDLSDKLQGLIEGISTLDSKPSPKYPQNPKVSKEVPLQTGKIDPFDCTDVLRQLGNKSGVYKIKPPHAKEPFEVYCDQETRGGGWTVIQNRFNGSVDFYRSWDLYKNGFGDVHGEFWLGLEKIHLITNYKINEIYFSLEDWDNLKAFASYDSFAIGPESKNYPISFLGVYEGTAGDSLRPLAGQPFTTFDRDNDKWKDNCAAFYTGAWWHKECFDCNLNGKYYKGGTLLEAQQSKAIIWGQFKGHKYSLKSTRMMVRPRVNQVLNEAG